MSIYLTDNINVQYVIYTNLVDLMYAQDLEKKRFVTNFQLI